MLFEYIPRDGICVDCVIILSNVRFPVFRGIGIRMTEPVYLSPSFDDVLPGYLFLQVSVCKSRIFSQIETYFHELLEM